MRAFLLSARVVIFRLTAIFKSQQFNRLRLTLFGMILGLISVHGFALETDVFFQPSENSSANDTQTLLWVDTSRDMRCDVNSASCPRFSKENSRLAIVKQGLRDWILSLPDGAAVGLGGFSGAGAQVSSPVKSLGHEQAWSGRAEAVLSSPQHDVLIQAGGMATTSENSPLPLGELTLTPNTESINGSQIRLYFPRLNLPPAADIQQAALVLTPRESIAEPQSLKIAFAHSPKAFLANMQDGRFQGFGVSKMVNLPAVSSPNVPQEIDITAAFRSHVFQGKKPWCFGEGVGLSLSQSGLGERAIGITSFEEEPDLAPRLIVRYRAGASGRRCAVSESTAFVAAPEDDASLGDIRGNATSQDGSDQIARDKNNVNADSLVLSREDPIALGFRHVRFQSGLNTRLDLATVTVTAATPLAAGTQLRLSAHYLPQSQSLSLFYRNFKEAKRRKGGPIVRWVLPKSVAVGAEVVSPDLSILLSPLLMQSRWTTGDSIVLMLEAQESEGAIRGAQVHQGGQAKLFLRWRAHHRNGYLQSHRYRLLDAISRLGMSGARSTSLSLTEAGRYWSGQPAELGLWRAAINPFQANLLSLSAPEVFLRKPLSRQPSGCVGLDLRDSACSDYHWVGRPVYDAPELKQCVKNNTAVMLSGLPDDKMDNALEEIGEMSSATLISLSADNDAVSAKKSKTSDLRYAQDRQSLLFELQQLEVRSSPIAQQSVGLASVPVVMDGYNRRHSKSIYFSLFEKSDNLVWAGNLKRYALDLSRAEITDQFGRVAFSENKVGEKVFQASSKSFWSGGADGNALLSGGALEQLPKKRNLLTHVGHLQYRKGAWVPKTENDARAVALAPSKQVLARMGLTDSSFSAVKKRFKKKFKEIIEEVTTKSGTAAFGSFLGAKPLVVQYDATPGAERSTVFVSSNKGFLHAFDDESGEELFGFMPQSLLSSLLPKLPDLQKRYRGDKTQPLVYGLDSPWIAWRHDAPILQKNEKGEAQWRRDGVISESVNQIEKQDELSNDLVMLYGGMGRGGRNVYGLDVTRSVVNSSDPSPTVRFVIRGGEKGPFARLGQTWSKPVLTQMQIHQGAGVARRPVIIFAGGYDSAVFDNLPDALQKLPTTTLGNAIYIVDALTGELLWWASQKSGSVKHPDLKYSIPMSVKVLDTNGDGLTDRLYFADILGQVFRVQFEASKGQASIEKIADFGVQNADAPSSKRTSLVEYRNFFKSPSVAIVRDGVGQPRVALALGSGNLTQPLAKVSQDGLFVFYDDLILDNSNQSVQVNSALRAIDLPKINGTNSAGFKALQLDADQRGWQIALNRMTGEKVLSSPLILNEQVFFATFSPRKETVCTDGAESHMARLYSVSLKDASANDSFQSDGSSLGAHPVNHGSFPINGFLPEIQFVQQGKNAALLFGAHVLPFGANKHGSNIASITTTQWRRLK